VRPSLRSAGSDSPYCELTAVSASIGPIDQAPGERSQASAPRVVVPLSEVEPSVAAVVPEALTPVVVEVPEVDAVVPESEVVADALPSLSLSPTPLSLVTDPAVVDDSGPRLLAPALDIDVDVDADELASPSL
jgi:hypothetical protein